MLICGGCGQFVARALLFGISGGSRRSDSTDIPRSTDPASYDDEVKISIPLGRVSVSLGHIGTWTTTQLSSGPDDAPRLSCAARAVCLAAIWINDARWTPVGRGDRSRAVDCTATCSGPKHIYAAGFEHVTDGAKLRAATHELPRTWLLDA